MYVGSHVDGVCPPSGRAATRLPLRLVSMWKCEWEERDGMAGYYLSVSMRARSEEIDKSIVGRVVGEVESSQTMLWVNE